MFYFQEKKERLWNSRASFRLEGPAGLRCFNHSLLPSPRVKYEWMEPWHTGWGREWGTGRAQTESSALVDGSPPLSLRFQFSPASTTLGAHALCAVWTGRLSGKLGTPCTISSGGVGENEKLYIPVWLLHQASMGCSMKNHKWRIFIFLMYDYSLLYWLALITLVLKVKWEISRKKKGKQKLFNCMLLGDLYSIYYS